MMNNAGVRKKKANAVFEGGGVKGIGIAGALTVAGQYYDWVYVAGTSAGALIASMVAAGYTSGEIRDKVFDLDYRRFQDIDSLGEIPVIGPFLSLEFGLGIFKGNYLEEWIRETLKEKGVQRFGDLVVTENAKNPQGRYRLRVVASDISSGEMLILPQDIARYGFDPDYLEVAKAIRMSMSIPYFFQPVTIKYVGKDGKQSSGHIVDGGVLSNFPVWLFDRDTCSKGLPTLGFRLTGPNAGRPNEIRGPLSMLKALFDTMMEAHDNHYIEDKNFDRTISIPTLGVRTTDFGITAAKARELFQSGVSAAELFFKGWDYQRYLIKHVGGRIV